MKRILFARIGWMRLYDGPKKLDPRPVRGGAYNEENIGHELYNFHEFRRKYYGYFPLNGPNYQTTLERIDPHTGDADVLSSVLVVFFATHPDGLGQVIVGWYRDAKVYRNRVLQSPGKPDGYGHSCMASTRNCVLLPEDERKHKLPGSNVGKGGVGTTAVTYAFDSNLKPKEVGWIQGAIEFIENYERGKIHFSKGSDLEKESAIAAESALERLASQGFALNLAERKALEKRAMNVATRHFEKKGYGVKDVSSNKPYDLECQKNGKFSHVEVKGTTTNGDVVIITNREMLHAQSHKDCCILFVLHSMTLVNGKASGGKKSILEPWNLQEDKLTPISFRYRIN